MRTAGLLRFAPRYTEASGRVAVELYKAEIEAQLRTPGLGGFSLLELNDYPGQTMGIVGILDVFWDSKGLVKPEQWRRFCAPVVPLLRFPKRVYTIDDTFAATAEVANYGPRDLPAVGAIWRSRMRPASSLRRENCRPRGSLRAGLPRSAGLKCPWTTW